MDLQDVARIWLATLERDYIALSFSFSCVSLVSVLRVALDRGDGKARVVCYAPYRSIVSLGSYFCYDNPAALQQKIQDVSFSIEATPPLASSTLLLLLLLLRIWVFLHRSMSICTPCTRGPMSYCASLVVSLLIEFLA